VLPDRLKQRFRRPKKISVCAAQRWCGCPRQSSKGGVGKGSGLPGGHRTGSQAGIFFIYKRKKQPGSGRQLLIEAKARANLVESGERFGKGSENSHEPIERIRTDETLADMAGVSSNTIRKVERITHGDSVGAAPGRAGRQASTAVPAVVAATWCAR